MTTTESIISLISVKNFTVKNGQYLQDGCYTRITVEDNLYYLRIGTKIYVCYSKDEPHDESIDCLAAHFKVQGNSKLQPFAAKDYSKA